jgi:hypothetical protein
MPKELDDKVFALKTGQVSDVIRTKQGYVILLATEHQMAGIPSLKEAEPRIQDAFYMQKLAAGVARLFDHPARRGLHRRQDWLHRLGRERQANQARRDHGERSQNEETEKEEEARRVLG